MISELIAETAPEWWNESAACAESDVDFFPVGEDMAGVLAAKSVCAECPVRDECLAFAIETRQDEGVWGATTPNERRKLRRAWLKELREAS